MWCSAPLNNDTTLAHEPWPQADDTLLQAKQFVLVIQINGKKRAEQTLPVGTDEAKVTQSALADDRVQKWLNGTPPKKVIYVEKAHILSIVV